MIREHFDTLDGITERGDEVASLVQGCLAVGDARHEDLANPHRLALLGEPGEAVEDVGVVAAGEPAVALGINVLDVCHHEVAGIEDATKRREGRLLAGERSEGGVEAGVDAAGVRGLEKLGYEFGLGESLAAGDGDAALGTPVAPVALGAVKELVDAHEGATLGTPGIRVVAEAAAHGATLKEDKETTPSSEPCLA